MEVDWRLAPAELPQAIYAKLLSLALAVTSSNSLLHGMHCLSTRYGFVLLMQVFACLCAFVVQQMEWPHVARPPCARGKPNETLLPTSCPSTGFKTPAGTDMKGRRHRCPGSQSATRTLVPLDSRCFKVERRAQQRDG